MDPPGSRGLERMATFPLIPTATDSSQMMISLPGVVIRAAECCSRSRDSKHLEYMLRKLVEHIEMLRESESDEEAVRRLANFLAVWVD